jgi:putative aldouronate transport system substrate-binding protein
MKNCLDFLRKLYAEGLLDPEFLTCTEASWATKMVQDDKSFVTFDWIDRMDLFYDQIKGEKPDYNLDFGYPIGPKAKYIKLSKYGATTVSASLNKKSDTAMKLLDFLLSPAGAKLTTLGVEGISYELEDDTVKYNLPEGTSANINTLEEQYGLFNAVTSLRYDPTCVYYQYTPHVQAAQDFVKENNLLRDKPDEKPNVTTNSERFTELQGELDTQFDIMASKYIVGEGDADELWNSWLAQAKQLGVDEMLEIANAQ